MKNKEASYSQALIKFQVSIFNIVISAGGMVKKPKHEELKQLNNDYMSVIKTATCI